MAGGVVVIGVGGEDEEVRAGKRQCKGGVDRSAYDAYSQPRRRFEMELPARDETHQMQVVPIMHSSMNLDARTSSDASTSPVTDPRLSRSPNAEARVWSAPPKSTYSSKSIRNIESALQKTSRYPPIQVGPVAARSFAAIVIQQPICTKPARSVTRIACGTQSPPTDQAQCLPSRTPGSPSRCWGGQMPAC